MPSNADGPFEVLMFKFLWTPVRRRNIKKGISRIGMSFCDTERKMISVAARNWMDFLVKML
jgi:hypothetical protein